MTLRKIAGYLVIGASVVWAVILAKPSISILVLVLGSLLGLVIAGVLSNSVGNDIGITYTSSDTSHSSDCDGGNGGCGGE